MSRRQIGWGILLAGLPFAPFLFQGKLDIWHAQTLFAQCGILLLFGASLAAYNYRVIDNKPLAAWFLWIAASSMYAWTTTLIGTGIYPLPMLQGIVHCLMLTLFYVAAIGAWNSLAIEHYLRWIAYAGVAILIYCCLQLLNMDQFFSNLAGGKSVNLVGLTGNPTHLGTHLALLIPIFLHQHKRVWTLIAVFCSVMMLKAYSAGAIVALACGLLFMFYLNYPRYKWHITGGLISTIVLTLFFFPKFASLNGRVETWQLMLNFLREKAVTGHGLGFLMEYSRMNKAHNLIPALIGWRHAHNEFLQIAIEQGVVGLSLFLWLIHDYFVRVARLRKSRLVVTLSGIFVIFLVNSLTSYPMHLWITGSLALLAYCGTLVIYREEFC